MKNIPDQPVNMWERTQNWEPDRITDEWNDAPAGNNVIHHMERNKFSDIENEHAQPVQDSKLDLPPG
jgi:hypothetical protein